MSKLDANRSAEERLDQFLEGISVLEIQSDGNSPAEKPSRWIKWGFSNAGATQPGYQLVKKSESKIFNRLLDRIDRVAGRARQAANEEITRMLEESGVEVTNEIKKHLPGKHKLGNAEKLAHEIKSARATREATERETLERLRREMPVILENCLKNFIETKKSPTDILRNKSLDKYLFRAYIRPLFQSKADSFVQNFLKDLKKIESPMTEDALKLLIENKQKDFFHVITKSAAWKAVESILYDACIDETVSSYQRGIFSSDEEKLEYYNFVKSFSFSMLTFASPSSFLADAVANSSQELKTEFGRIMNTQNKKEIMKMTRYFSSYLNNIADNPANKNT